MSEGWDGKEKRRRVDGKGFELSEEQESRIADAAAERIKEWLYVELGKATFRALFLLAGTIGAGALAWFSWTSLK